jgi:pimeloyl-ACP methyl ester carboxylesterase
VATEQQEYRGAAAYVVPPTSRWLRRSTWLEIAIVLEVFVWVIFPTWRADPMAWMLAGVSVPVLGWLAVRRVVMHLFLRSPTPEDGRLSDPHWTPFRFEGWGGDVLTAHLLHGPTEDAGLVLYLHGYGSSLRSGESRCQHLNEQHLHVVSMNLRGHGGCELRREWTLLKVVADIEAMLEQLTREMESLPSKVWIYGHSMGGFLALRLGAHPSGWWQDRLAGVMLESPATSFPMAIERAVPAWLKFTMPFVRWILRREYESMHPDLPLRYATAAVPHIGLPGVPMLVMQASEDTRLGQRHHELLAHHLSRHSTASEVHLIRGHVHTSKRDTEKRKRIVEDWLNPTDAGVLI